MHMPELLFWDGYMTLKFSKPCATHPFLCRPRISKKQYVLPNISAIQIQKERTLAAILTGYLYFKTKMGMAGLIFEPHPPNFENIYNF